MSTRAIQIEFLLAGLIDPTTEAALTDGTVYFYEAGTNTAKNVWTEKEKTNAYTEYTLATGGLEQLYGDGIYKVVVKDSDGSTVFTWDDIKIRAHNYSVVTKTSDYTATTDDDVILVNNTSGNVTITFPAAADMEYPITVIHISGSNDVILDPNGSETIDGSSTYTFSSTNSAVTAISDGSNLRKSGNVALNLVDGATGEFSNTGLSIQDTGGDHALTLKCNEDLSAAKTLSIKVDDGDRTLDLDASFTVSTDRFTSGTIMAFGQDAAPTGWTRLTTGDTIYDNGTDNAMFCFAKTGNVGQGGSSDPQATHTHTYTDIVNHVHPFDAAGNASSNTHNYVQSGNTQYDSASFDTDNPTGGDSSGTTNANTAPYYIEMILAKKD